MTGHAILDSCHNCGEEGVPLFVVSVSEGSASCGEFVDQPNYHHIHVFVACERCKAEIWDREAEA